MTALRIPLLAGLEETDMDTALELGGARFIVDRVNWPDAFPYAPLCGGRIARTEDSLIVDFHVSGLDLRVQNLSDNQRQWEDSCCEFFVADPSDGTYYNFELTCIGSLLAAKRTSRTEKTMFTGAQLGRVIRHSTLPRKEFHSEGGPFSWSVALLVPFDLIGVDPADLPPSLKGNFYKCGDGLTVPHYITWAPIDTPRPDYHRPEFFAPVTFAPAG